jgi:hypothetical protein
MVSFPPRSRMKLVKLMLYPGLGMIAAMKGGCQSRIMNEMLPRSSMNSRVLEDKWDYSWRLVINSRAWHRDSSWLPPSSVCFLLCYHFSSQALDFVLSIAIPPLLTRLDITLRGRKPSRPPSVQPSRAAKATINTAEFYEEFVPEG